MAEETRPPARREPGPEDPFELCGVELPGDPDLMLALLVEEYARLGWGAEAILELARSPFYQAFHALYEAFGEETFRSRVADALARCRVRPWKEA